MPSSSESASKKRTVGRVRIWMTAIRPRTLTIAVAPVLLGTALAWADGVDVRWHLVLLILLCAICIQIGTNLHNDVADFRRGTDAVDRLGPLRVTSAGWVRAEDVGRATYIAYGLAALVGLYLVILGGWWIAAVGVASLAAGWSYSGGRRPLSHTAWGELVVLIFFGLIAVGGTYWLQAQQLTVSAFVCGAILGLPAAAVLLVNNFRDRDGDVRAGRCTLAARLGDNGAQQMFAFLLLAPFALVVALAWLGYPYSVASLILLPHAWSLRSRLSRSATGASLNTLLAATARLELLLSIVLALGVQL